ncbi:hypothetical protein [Pararhodobacter zhoushanensis]|uniref:Uncharacterized protein n=1 Tax=Pararhodobacter zhoushanensis TaxID=2479545 RepID=A0ABT3GX32_9RHOB|nr:hypothetical protein [Pararhodobacter zhoushanensis]MCW1932119.1 hypothetical protein [Pararhodobacter zhoushanensis]
MNDTALRLALREMHAAFSRPGPWVIVAAVVVALAVSGPFGTLASLGFATRLAYWAAVVVLTLGAGWLATQGCVHALARRGIGRIGQWLIASLTVSAVTAAVVGVLNVLAFGFYVTDRGAVADLLTSTVPIALMVTAAFIWGFPRLPRPPRCKPPARNRRACWPGCRWTSAAR